MWGQCRDPTLGWYWSGLSTISTWSACRSIPGDLFNWKTFEVSEWWRKGWRYHFVGSWRANRNKEWHEGIPKERRLHWIWERGTAHIKVFFKTTSTLTPHPTWRTFMLNAAVAGRLPAMRPLFFYILCFDWGSEAPKAFVTREDQLSNRPPGRGRGKGRGRGRGAPSKDAGEVSEKKRKIATPQNSGAFWTADMVEEWNKRRAEPAGEYDWGWEEADWLGGWLGPTRTSLGPLCNLGRTSVQGRVRIQSCYGGGNTWAGRTQHSKQKETQEDSSTHRWQKPGTEQQEGKEQQARGRTIEEKKSWTRDPGQKTK